MRAILLICLAAVCLPASAETMTAASPCLPATLPPSADLDTDASINKAATGPITFDIYKDIGLRGAIYGEAVVATVTVDPQTGTVTGLSADPTAAATSSGCH